MTNLDPQAAAQSKFMCPDEAEGHNCFPYAYALGFLRFLRQEQSIHIITYADLDFDGDEDFENNYPIEFERWKARVRATPWMRDEVFVLIQHDVDALPRHTMRMLEDEHRLGLKSNVMIFCHRVHRRILETQGKVIETEYEVDTDLLLKLEQHGFVIGYHSNAYERAGFDADRAAAIFEDDVATLRQRFNIRFFSHHGGVRDASGHSNNIIDPPLSVQNTLRWVHNRHSVRFHGRYSDGGINNAKRNRDTLDLMAFVRTWQRGKRYRVLVHPQYYGDPVVPAPRLLDLEWYRHALAIYSVQRDHSNELVGVNDDPWRQFELPPPPPKPPTPSKRPKPPKPPIYERILHGLFRRK